jgi:hypothetical protein
MAEGRLRHYVNGKFKKIPELNCLMSSADSSWSGLLVERQKYDAGRVSEPVCVYPTPSRCETRRDHMLLARVGAPPCGPSGAWHGYIHQ